MNDDQLHDFLVCCPKCVNKGEIFGCEKRSDGLVQCKNCHEIWQSWTAWLRACNWHHTSKKAVKLLKFKQDQKDVKKK